MAALGWTVTRTGTSHPEGDRPPQSAPWAAASLCAVRVALWTGPGPQRPLQRSGGYQHLVSDSSVAFLLSLGHAAGAWRAGYAGGEGGGQGCAGRCGMAPKTQVTRAARHCVVSWLFKSPLKCSNFCSVSSLREPPAGRGVGAQEELSPCPVTSLRVGARAGAGHRAAE